MLKLCFEKGSKVERLKFSMYLKSDEINKSLLKRVNLYISDWFNEEYS